jgi:hypothetical protein
MKTTEQCALCLQSAELRNSRIISESLYADLYEASPRRFSIITLDRNVKDTHPQKGIREKLLCHTCEQLLGNNYESYGAETFRQLKTTAVASKTSFCSAVDYQKFKLFQLAQLWRMANSKNPIWQRVRLQSAILEQLRLMLLNGDPKSFDCFGVMMEAIVADDGEAFDAFFPPITIRLGDYQFVLATFAGFSWYYCAHPSVTDVRISKYFLTESGSIEIKTLPLK